MTTTPPADTSFNTAVESTTSSFNTAAVVGSVTSVVVAVIIAIVIVYVVKTRKRGEKTSTLQAQPILSNPTRSSDRENNTTGAVYVDVSSATQSLGREGSMPEADQPMLPRGGALWGVEGARDNSRDSLPIGPRKYGYQELSRATKNFSQSELLGAGGFGPVYRGTLPEDGTQVAVKCIADNSKQGAKEYNAEVTIISDLRHRNLVRLLGWCHSEGKLLLVYDYMPNGSLDHLLFNDSLCHKLRWERRYSIASGLGSALIYLHEECDKVILHRDIKSSNVLLDENFVVKLGDFGLSRQVMQGVTSHTTVIAGTRGYMAPECCVGIGKATRESDVFAFGAVLLELVCGKSVIDAMLIEEGGMLVDWVWQLHGQGKVMEAVDTRLEGRFEKQEARRMLLVGLMCSHPDPNARPKARRAVEALKGFVPLPSVPACKPAFSLGPVPMTVSQVLEASTNSIAST